MAITDHSEFADDSNHRGGLARFFGVLIDPKTYGALLYMFLALATGTFYFTWVVTGLSLSFGLMVLIIGIPLALLFLASVRVISYAEGYLATGLLGADMTSQEAAQSFEAADETTQDFWGRIKSMLKDRRTWTSMIYMVLQLGLGIAYFTFAVTTLAVSLSFIAAPFVETFLQGDVIVFDSSEIEFMQSHAAWLASVAESPYGSWLLVPIGAALLLLSLHVVRGVGAFHKLLAEALLVRRR